ncbi:hypothetical protein ACTTAF_01680 [Rhodobacter capsulatus]|uniref:hypothetical protein n=1 Tax=Rhodobacter capsulatus TaxID=1061 RepID=UPI00103A3313|nr:hypothetical protein [Rhodobacter capsulatus]
MAVPNKYSEVYLPVRSFLTSFRAYSDGCVAVSLLEKDLQRDYLVLSDWKIHWVAACALLRAAIEMFRVDQEMCVPLLAKSVKEEWNEIGRQREAHRIYWQFLRDERNNILHEYKWSAYEVYLDKAGKAVFPRPSLLSLVVTDECRGQLMVRHGGFAGQPAFEVIKAAEKWVGDRILSVIARAGLDPGEERSAHSFLPRPVVAPAESFLGTGTTILGQAPSDKS